MFGNNPILPPTKGDGSVLDIQAIFPTFQGEGPYAGWPAVFIRLGGCNLACTFCDTEFDSYQPMALDALLEKVATYSPKLAVITGGEPFRQPIALLCEALLAKGYSIQIESNGTLYRPIPAEVDIICSPKNTGSGYHRLRDDLLVRVSGLKFIISASNPLYQDVGEVGQAEYNIPVYVQPMDEYDAAKNKANLDRAVQLVQERGYRLSLQLHKIAGVE